MADRYLIARLRPRDRDITEEIDRRNLAPGELSDIVREGVRRVFFDQDPKPKALDPILAELKEKSPDNLEDVEALVDDLLMF